MNDTQSDRPVVALCRIDDVATNSVLAVSVPNLPPLAVYNVDGSCYVTEGLCTHGNASLAEGILEGDEIECPLHAGRFCVRTGVATLEPAEVSLRTHRTIVRDGIVHIEMPHPSTTNAATR